MAANCEDSWQQHDRRPQRSKPLVRLQSCTEDFLKESGLDYTILRLCGFHQAIIGNYAVPILEEKPVWGTNDDTRTAYLDTVDISRMAMAAIRAPGASKASLTLAGPKSWTTSEVRPRARQQSVCLLSFGHVMTPPLFPRGCRYFESEWALFCCHWSRTLVRRRRNAWGDACCAGPLVLGRPG